ncbi:MAG: hypothetical protein QXU99_00650 [Candidatus Bathyarchaeia archaeon]
MSLYVILEMDELEHCKNPWNNKCVSEDIMLYILLRGEKLPVCRRCWSELADSEVYWEG